MSIPSNSFSSNLRTNLSIAWSTSESLSKEAQEANSDKSKNDEIVPRQVSQLVAHLFRFLQKSEVHEDQKLSRVLDNELTFLLRLNGEDDLEERQKTLFLQLTKLIQEGKVDQAVRNAIIEAPFLATSALPCEPPPPKASKPLPANDNLSVPAKTAALPSSSPPKSFKSLSTNPPSVPSEPPKTISPTNFPKAPPTPSKASEPSLTNDNASIPLKASVPPSPSQVNPNLSILPLQVPLNGVLRRNWKANPTVTILSPYVKNHYDEREDDKKLIYSFLELKDGTLAGCFGDGRIKLWDRKESREITLAGHTEPVSALIELNDKTLVTGSKDKTIKLWDRDGNCLMTLIGHTEAVNTLIELENDTIASGSDDGTIKLWNRKGDCIKTLESLEPKDTRSIKKLFTLKDGSLACQHVSSIYLWNQGGLKWPSLIKYPQPISSFIELKNSRLAIHGESKQICIWDLKGNSWSNKTLIAEVFIELRDGTLVCNDYRRIKVWDQYGNCLRVIEAHYSKIDLLFELKDGTVVSSSKGEIKFWDKQWNCLKTLPGNAERVVCFCELMDGTLVGSSKMLLAWSFPLENSSLENVYTASSDESAFERNWRANPKVQILSPYTPVTKCKTVEGPTGGIMVESVVVNDHMNWIGPLIELKDGALAGCFGDGRIKLWDRKESREITLAGHTKPVSALIELNDKTLVTGSKDKTIKLWDRDGNCLMTLIGHTEAVNTLIELENDTIASGSDDGTIKLWDRKGDCISTLTNHGQKWNIEKLFTLRNGSLACRHHNSIYLWDQHGFKQRLVEHESYINSFIELQDGHFVSCNDYNIKIWTRNESWPKVIKARAKFLLDLGDGTFAGNYSGKIHVWDREGNCLKVIDADNREINRLFKLKNGLVVSCSVDKVKLWDKQWNCLKTLSGHAGGVISFLELHDGTLASSSKTLLLWSFPPKRDVQSKSSVNFEENNFKTDWKADPSVQTFPCQHSKAITTLIKLKGGLLASGGEDAIINLWDQRGNCTETLVGHNKSISILCELKDGVLASGSESVKLWDLDKGTCFMTLAEQKDRDCTVWGLLELEDGTLAASFSKGYERSIQHWNRMGECLKIFSGRFESPLIKLHDETLVCRESGVYKFWDREENCLKVFKDGAEPEEIRTCSLIGTMQWHRHPISATAQLKDGTIISGCNGGIIKLWDRQRNCLNVLKEHTGPISALQILDHNTLASASHDKSIKLWRFPSLEEELTSDTVLTNITSKESTSSGEVIPKKNWRVNPSIQTIKWFDRVPACVMELSDGSLIISDPKYGEEYAFKRWDRKEKRLRPLFNGKGQITSLFELKNGNLIGNYSQRGRGYNIMVWNKEGKYQKSFSFDNLSTLEESFELTNGTLLSLRKEREKNKYDEHYKERQFVGLGYKGNSLKSYMYGDAIPLLELPDGALVSYSKTSKNQGVDLWDREGIFLKTMENIGIPILVENGNLVTNLNGSLTLWDFKWNFLKILPCEANIIRLKDGTFASYTVNLSGQYSISLWDSHWNCLKTFVTGHNTTSLTELRDGTLLSSSSKDGMIKLWDREGNCLYRSMENSAYNLIELSDGTLAFGYDRFIKLLSFPNVGEEKNCIIS